MTRHHHFPMQAIDGRWHVVYRDRAGALQSVSDHVDRDDACCDADGRNGQPQNGIAEAQAV